MGCPGSCVREATKTRSALPDRTAPRGNRSPGGCHSAFRGAALPRSVPSPLTCHASRSSTWRPTRSRPFLPPPAAARRGPEPAGGGGKHRGKTLAAAPLLILPDTVPAPAFPPTPPPRGELARTRAAFSQPHLQDVAVPQGEGEPGVLLHHAAVLQRGPQADGHLLALAGAALRPPARHQRLLLEQAVPCAGRNRRRFGAGRGRAKSPRPPLR